MENPLLIAEAVFKVIEKGSEQVTLLPFWQIYHGRQSKLIAGEGLMTSFNH